MAQIQPDLQPPGPEVPQEGGEGLGALSSPFYESPAAFLARGHEESNISSERQ